MQSGPFAKASDKVYDHYSLIKPWEESTSCKLDIHHAHKIRERHFSTDDEKH